MVSEIYSALNGLQNCQEQMAQSAHNIANLTTVGFKSRHLRSSVDAGGFIGGRVARAFSNFSQGAIQRTDIPSDLAVEGNGFFRVESALGETLYTRSGNFTRNAQGFLVTISGEFLMGSRGRVQIPPDADAASVGRDGVIRAMDGEGRFQPVGTLELAIFPDESGLPSRGGGLYQATTVSGTPSFVQPGTGGAGYVQSGALEISNVDFAEEAVSMIFAKRSFEANAAVIRTADDLTRLILSLRKEPTDNNAAT